MGTPIDMASRFFSNAGACPAAPRAIVIRYHGIATASFPPRPGTSLRGSVIRPGNVEKRGADFEI
jgi:hypothetical protein